MTNDDWKGKYENLLSQMEHHKKRNELATAWLEALTGIISSEAIARSSQFSKKFQRLQKLLPVTDQNQETLKPVIDGLQDIHEENAKKGNVEREKVQDLVGKVLSHIVEKTKRQNTRDQVSILIGQITRLSSGESLSPDQLQKTLRQVQQFTEELSERPTTGVKEESLKPEKVEEKETAPEVKSPTKNADVDELVNSIFNLSSCLGLEDKIHKVIQSQIKKVQKSGDIKEIGGLVRKISIELARQNSSENSSLLNNLNRINSKVDQISGLVNKLSEHRKALKEERKGFEKFLDDKVKSLNAAISSNTNEEVWDKVVPSFNALTSTIHDLRENEASKENELETTLNGIYERVKKMEVDLSRTALEVKESSEKLDLDSLTKLPNRDAYDKRFEQELGRMNREGHQLFIAIIDIDNFKSVNDRYGRPVGDRVLSIIAKKLQKQCEEADFIARYGGEEFIVLSRSANKAEFEKKAKALNMAVARSNFTLKNEKIIITVSIGMSEFILGVSPRNTVSKAKSALYEAKNQGRNSVIGKW